MTLSPAQPRPLTWVVGAGGLLGQHLTRSLEVAGNRFVGDDIPWGSPEAGSALAATAHRLLDAARDRPWQVVWAAGAGVTSATRSSLEDEVDVFRGALDSIADAMTDARAEPARGAVFFSSSAGGVYAGVPAPPHDERSPVRPLAAYGEAKLAAEGALAAWSTDTGVASLAGRIANLYGPGQNLAKAQGLISQLCWHDLLARPLSIYVPLDTIRDYLYAPDCADLVLAGLDALRAEAAVSAPGLVRTKVLASGRAVSIAHLIGVLRSVVRHKPRLVLASRPAAAVQALNLALRSVVYPEVDRRSITPLQIGLAATRADLALQLEKYGPPR